MSQVAPNDTFQKLKEFLPSFFTTSNNSPSLTRARTTATTTAAKNVVISFLSSLTNITTAKDPRIIINYFHESISYTDTAFYNTVQGTDALLKHFHVSQGSSSTMTLPSITSFDNDDDNGVEDVPRIVIEDIATSTNPQSNTDTNTEDGTTSIRSTTTNVSVIYHLEQNNETMNNTQSIAFFQVLSPSKKAEDSKIINVFSVTEPSDPKPGDTGLKILKAASSVLSVFESNDDDDSETATVTTSSTSSTSNDEMKNNVEKYFNSWNKRDMDTAITLFSQDCTYYDLQYPYAINGQNEMKDHLNKVSDCLPKSFEFFIDDMADASSSSSSSSSQQQKSIVGAKWHVENAGEELPFTRGASMYTMNDKTGLIEYGVDIPEPAVVKTGITSALITKLKDEPIRIIPLVAWVAYMYIVFFSDGILPGANALTLEQRTWEEVRDLSLNFFLVSPILNLPFAPTVHPMLEGVFNLLLAWAGMFAGFLSDEREDKPNVLEMGPIVIGMQFLTSAFLLPYLFTRTSERSEEVLMMMSGINNDADEDVAIAEDVMSSTPVKKEDITGSVQALIGEWKPLGALLGSVGTVSIFWALYARQSEFGVDWNERYASFIDLLSIDRVGSSFLVDLAIFALFQCWFIDDDLLRRGVSKDMNSWIRNVGKFVPFFGLALYLTLRPSLSSNEAEV